MASKDSILTAPGIAGLLVRREHDFLVVKADDSPLI